MYGEELNLWHKMRLPAGCIQTDICSNSYGKAKIFYHVHNVGDSVRAFAHKQDEDLRSDRVDPEPAEKLKLICSIIFTEIVHEKHRCVGSGMDSCDCVMTLYVSFSRHYKATLKNLNPSEYGSRHKLYFFSFDVKLDGSHLDAPSFLRVNTSPNDAGVCFLSKSFCCRAKTS